MEFTFDIGSFLAGLIGGGAAGSFLTFRLNNSKSASGSGKVVDQNRAKAGGDIVGGNKTER